MREIPASVKRVLNTLVAHKHQAYIVGGCVRDIIMDVEPHDWDITTSATPDEVKACFPQTIDTGIKHGTVTVVMDGENFEVTTFRLDGTYEDHRHPEEVSFTACLVEDLSRRDFHMNAIAMDMDGHITDPFGGKADIAAKQITCVGNPNKRFQEDALRILRAMRFASRLGFEITPNTAQMMHANKGLLRYVSAERIQKEFVSILCGDYARQVLMEFRDIIAVIIPEIEACFDCEQNHPSHCYDVYEHIVQSVYEIPYPDPILKLAMFFHDIGKPQTRVTDKDGINHFYGHAKVSKDIAEPRMSFLRFDTETKTAVIELVGRHDAEFTPSSTFVLHMLNKMGETQFRRLLEVRKADVLAQSYLNRQARLDKVANTKIVLERVLKEQRAFKVKDLAINGDDLITAGFLSGPEMGKLLNIMLQAVIDGDLENNKTALLDFAKKQ